jgi:hypothetical protein
MNAYRIHVNTGWNIFDRGVEELGPRRLADVPAMITSMKEPACEFLIGFYKGKKADFMAISYVGNDEYLLLSDRIVPPRSLFARFFGSRHIHTIVYGDEEAFDAVKLYMERPRQEFEERYYRPFGPPKW